MFDIEANDWTKFEMIGFYDGKNYNQFDSIGEFFSHVLTRRYEGVRIYGHYAGRYDSLFLLDHIQKHKMPIKFETITQGSKILELKLKKGHHCWRFVDSSGLFPGLSLSKLSQSFDTTHKKLDGSIDFEKEKVSRKNRRHQEYLKNDCMSLYEVIEKYSQDPKIAEDGLALTAASQAMSLWKRTLRQDIRVTPQRVQDFCRRSYTGGRVEIFKMRGDDLALYDVNSLFPFVMRNNRFPGDYRCETRSLTDRLAFLDASVYVPDTYLPVLPFRRDDGKLLFPTGVFRGVFFSEELKLGVEQGVKILKIHEGHEFYEIRDLFTEFVDYWYDKKSRAPKGSAAELIAKLCLNSCYGKFGQREQTEILKTWEGEKNYEEFHSERIFEATGLIKIKKFQRSSHMLAHIASAVTAFARIEMARSYLLPHQSGLCYTDTDSLFTRQRLGCGGKIGELKLEAEAFSGEFRLPKAYFLHQSGNRILAKVKGFSKSYISSLNLKDFTGNNIRENQSRPATVRVSLIRNGNYLSKIGVTRSLQASYDKRRVLKSGDTEPWEIRDGLIVNKGEKHGTKHAKDSKGLKCKNQLDRRNGHGCSRRDSGFKDRELSRRA